MCTNGQKSRMKRSTLSIRRERRGVTLTLSQKTPAVTGRAELSLSETHKCRVFKFSCFISLRYCVLVLSAKLPCEPTAESGNRLLVTRSHHEECRMLQFVFVSAPATQLLLLYR